MDETTIRSQIMAYFSFTSIKGNHGAGFQPSGGRKLENTGKFIVTNGIHYLLKQESRLI